MRGLPHLSNVRFIVPRARLNRSAPVVALLLATSACDQVPRIDLARMQVQSKLLPYSACAYFDDGRSMRTPADGTITREQIITAPVLLTSAEIPVPIDAALLSEGRQRYDIHCAACHGTLGDADSEVARHMELRKPPSLVDDEVRAYPNGRIYNVVTEGYGLMRSYATELSVTQRWAVVTYVRALQLSQRAALDQLPPKERAAAESALQ